MRLIEDIVDLLDLYSKDQNSRHFGFRCLAIAKHCGSTPGVRFPIRTLSVASIPPHSHSVDSYCNDVTLAILLFCYSFM